MQKRDKRVKIQNWNNDDVKMQGRIKKNKVYRTEILQMSICRDEESKLKYTELKDCRCQYTESKQAK